MSWTSSSSWRMGGWRGLRIPLTLIAAAAACLTSGCGGSSPNAPLQKGNTLVTVALSGTANDQLTEFDLGIQSISLTSQSGKTVSLLTALQETEFIHINGGIEPLVTVSIPQDVYTAATATVGGAQFTCVDLTPGSLATSTFAYGQTPSANVSVNLPAPITVTGDTMDLSLNLLVAQSAAYASCYSPEGIVSYAITPTFSLTPVVFSSQPTSPENGKVTGLNGEVSSVDTASSSFVVALPETESPRTISVKSGESTAYEGINNFSDVNAGTFVNLDGAIQADGSVLATRIAVEDTAATSVVTGPLLFVSNAEPALTLWGRQQQGALYADAYVLGGQYFSFGNAIFQISGQLPNLQDLPFTPSFSPSNMVPGQNVYLSASTLTVSGGFPYTPLSTVTLIPQTIDGTIAATSNSGNFAVYTIDLASYDLFPMLAVQPGQATLLNNPGQVQVYVDTTAQQLNTQALSPGSTFRFYGLVLNDNGTLRMDCAQINDGVPESPQPTPSARHRMEKGQAKIIRSGNSGGLRQTNRLVTPAP